MDIKEPLINDADIARSHRFEFRKIINSIRDARINKGLEYPLGSGNIYDSDKAAQGDVSGAVLSLSVLSSLGQGDGFTTKWIKADGEEETLDGAALLGLGMSLGKHVSDHKLEAGRFKKRLDNATDIDEMQSIVDEYKALDSSAEESVDADAGDVDTTGAES